MGKGNIGPSGVNKPNRCLWCGAALGWGPTAQIPRAVQSILDEPGKYSQGMIDWAVEAKGAALIARAENKRGYDGGALFCTKSCSEEYGGFFARSGYRVVYAGLDADGKDTWCVRVEGVTRTIHQLHPDERHGKRGN